MNLDTDEWGVSLLRIRANLDEALDENVELLLFGNVQLDAAESAPENFGPMQAFYFQSGLDDAPCAEAPDSGILIQTPEGVAEVNLLVNEVDIRLGSTAYLQAQPNREMTISVVEGQATVTAQGTSVLVPAGTRARVPMDANALASGVPVGPEPYTDGDLAALPLGNLAQEIVVQPALTEDEIQGWLTAIVPLSGQWMRPEFISECPNSEGRWPAGAGVEIAVADDGSTFTFVRAQTTFYRVNPGVYQHEVETQIVTFTATSPSYMEFENFNKEESCYTRGYYQLEAPAGE
jgi:hypothetical protein